MIDFFAYICPGAILLLSLLFWFKPNFEYPIFQKEFILVFLLLIVSYVLGLIIELYNCLSEQSASSFFSPRRPRNDRINQIVTDLAIRFSENLDDLELELFESSEELAFLGVLSNLDRSWERLFVYRTLMSDRLGDKGKTIIAEANNLRRRFLFSWGLALTLRVLALQALVRLLIFAIGNNYWDFLKQWDSSLPNIAPNILFSIAVGAFLLSFAMQLVANRFYNLEIYLTACLQRK